jgi:predicted transcriptional regulator
MFSKRVFETDLRAALEEELVRQNMTVKELAARSGIPLATLYKISGDRDVRFSTVRRIARVLEPRRKDFIAVIAAKFLLDEVEGEKIVVGNRELTIQGYPANSIDECIVAATLAQKDGAAGIVCAPILASVIEKIVDIPVAIIKPKPKMVLDSIDSIAKRL